MEENGKSTLFSGFSAFSIVVVLLIFMASCEVSAIEDYSFLNELEEDVELFLFISHENYSQKIAPNHLVKKGTSVRLLTVETKNRSGVGINYFNQLVDSAKVRIHGQEKYIAVWRQGVEPELAEEYEDLKDFYTYWQYYHQHAGTHAEYAYYLTLNWPWD